MKKLLLTCMLVLTAIVTNAQINLGTATAAKYQVPISTYFEYSYTQQIFTKSEINANAAGNITGLKFYLGSTAVIGNSDDWIVYLGTTTKTTFDTTSDYIPLANLTQVFAGTVTNNAGVIEIVFTVPFPYDNISNLVIAAEENKSGFDSNGSAEALFSYTGAANSTIWYRSDSTNPDPASPPVGNRAATKSVTTIVGLSPNATPSCPIVTAPAADAVGVVTTPTITYNAIAVATNYFITVGTTPGGSNILNNFDNGTATSYTFTTALPATTDIFYTVTAANGALVSSGCAERKFTTTVAAPANDNCAGAISLTVNSDLNCAVVGSGNTLGASQSMAATPCGGTPDDDVWYSFVATGTSHVVAISNVVSTGTTTSTDMYFQVFSGSCGTMTSVVCSDNDTGIASGLTAGTTYYVRVYTWAGSGRNASFDICIGTPPPPPANDDCAGEVALTVNPNYSCGVVTAGTTMSATQSTETPPTGASSGTNDDVWYKFTATSTAHRISLLNITGVTSDMAMSIYSGSCGSLVHVQYSDPETMNVTGLVVGTEYKVRVWTYTSTATTTASFEICIGSPPPPPANDDCAGAVTLTVNADLSCTAKTSGYTDSATQSTETAPSCVPAGTNDDVWYKFTATNALQTVTLSNVVGSTNMAMAAYSGVCGSLVEVACSDPNTMSLTGLTVGQEYTLRVWTNATTASATASFDICVGTPPPPPANDDCANAIAATTPVNGTPYTNTQDASSATNNGGFVSCGTASMNDGVWYTVVGDGANYTVDITNVSGGFDSEIGVYTGSCGSFTCVGSADNGFSNGNETLTFAAALGTTYYINIGNWSGTSDNPEGPFTITISTDNVSLGTTDIVKDDKSFTIAPNPFTDVVRISDVKDVVSISVVDLSGRVVKTMKPAREINLGDLKTGMYLINLTYKDGSVKTVKAIKK